MTTQEMVSTIPFTNGLPYEVSVYDSFSTTDTSNYLGQLSMIDSIAANSTKTIQPRHAASVFIISNTSTGSFVGRVILQPFGETSTIGITKSDEDAMNAALQFIKFLTTNPNDKLSITFNAIWNADNPDGIVDSVDDFFSQQPTYNLVTFPIYMLGLCEAARVPAKTPQQPMQATYSLSKLIIFLGGTWPSGLPDIVVSNFTCTKENDTLALQIQVNLQQLPAESDQVLKTFCSLLPSDEVTFGLQFHYGFDMGMFGTRLSAIFDNIHIPVGNNTFINIEKPTVIIDINPLFKFVVFTIQGTIPFTIFQKNFDAKLSLTVHNEEAAVSVVIDGDSGSLPSLPIMKGVHFDEFGLNIGVFFEPPACAVGVQGKFHIGQSNGANTVQLDDDTFVIVCQIEDGLPNPIYASFYVPKMDLNEVIEIFTDSQSQVDFPVSFTDLSFKWAENPMEPTILPDGTLASMAMGFSAGINIGSFGFYGDVSMDPNNGINALLESSPILFKEIFRLTGDGKGVVIKVDQNGNPIKNNQIADTVALQQLLKNAGSKQLVTPGGPILNICTSPSPDLHINGGVSFFELIDYAVKADISKDGIKFMLNFGNVLVGQMSCVLNNQLQAQFQFGINREISLAALQNIDIGSISLQAQITAHLVVEANINDITISVGGNFIFNELNRSFGDFQADIHIEKVSDLLIAIGDNIEDNAQQVFHDLMGTADLWAGNVKQSIISTIRNVGDVLKNAYGKGPSDVAEIMNQAGFGADDVAKALKDGFNSLNASQIGGLMKQAGFNNANEVASALKNMFSIEDISSMLQGIFGDTPDNISSILQQIGYSENDVENAFKSLGGSFEDFAKKIWDKFNPLHWKI